MLVLRRPSVIILFFFNDTATTEIYTLSLHDALPIYRPDHGRVPAPRRAGLPGRALHRGALAQALSDRERPGAEGDRKSTRVNSSHSQISYAVFCLKKKKTKK